MKSENFYVYMFILGIVKRNLLFLHEIEWKNNGFLFTTPNIYMYTQYTKKFHYSHFRPRKKVT